MDIPRIFNITESAHRIHNPFTPEKFATLGARCLKREPDCSTSAAVRGDAVYLGTRLRVIGTGIDMSPLFTGQAKRRAEELGVADQVKFIHGDAAGYVSDEEVDVAACVGATWIGGESPALSTAGAQPARRRDHPHWRTLLAAVTADRRRLPRGVLPTQLPTFSCFQNCSRLSVASAMTSLRWFWLTRTAGIDTRRLNGSPCADGLKRIPTTSCQRCSSQTDLEPERHAAYTREYLQGVFALMKR